MSLYSVILTSHLVTSTNVSVILLQPILHMSLDVIIPPSSATPYQLVPAGDVVIVVATTRRSGGRLSHIRHMLSLLSRGQGPSTILGVWYVLERRETLGIDHNQTLFQLYRCTL